MLNYFYINKKYLLLIAIIFIFLVLNSSSGFTDERKITPKYVGSDACKACHVKEYENFITYAKKATSYRSIERLQDKLSQEELTGCYFCHTTGYGKPGGFISIEKTPHLKNAGCEVCHGPGEFHIKTQNPKYIKSNLTVKDCEACHTEERVKAFRYKPLIHGGAH